MTKKPLSITIVVDNPKSWMNDFIPSLARSLISLGHKVNFIQNLSEIKKGDLAFFLSCEKIVSSDVLSKHTHNLVVHESDLPSGKGWSPLTWQVLEGKNKIPISLFEASSKVDSGDIYFSDFIELDGTELVSALREKQAQKTFDLILRFVSNYPNLQAKKQSGSETFYKKRSPTDSQLDINKTISEQFNLLRVVDNERYPAFFIHKGRKYIIKIYDGES